MAEITADIFNTLPDELKAEFEQTATGYSLKKENVEGLKKAKETILNEKKALETELASLRQFKTEFDKNKSAEEEQRLKKEGAFKELEERLRKELSDRDANYKTELGRLTELIKTERLTNELIKNGVMPDRVNFALPEIASKIELQTEKNQFNFKVKDGIGDANEFPALIESLKKSAPFLFQAGDHSGSGASGSQSNGGNADLSKMTARQKVEQGFKT